MRNKLPAALVRARVSLRALMAILAIQLAVLLAPIVLGLMGYLSGATAGLASVLAWFTLGVPLSYAAIDRPSNARTRARRVARRGAWEFARARF